MLNKKSVFIFSLLMLSSLLVANAQQEYINDNVDPVVEYIKTHNFNALTKFLADNTILCSKEHLKLAQEEMERTRDQATTITRRDVLKGLAGAVEIVFTAACGFALYAAITGKKDTPEKKEDALVLGVVSSVFGVTFGYEGLSNLYNAYSKRRNVDIYVKACAIKTLIEQKLSH